MRKQEQEVELVFHPIDRSSESDAFAAAVKTILDAKLDAKDGELRMVSPYLSANVLKPLLQAHRFRLVTDL
ncbi:MAG: hypothetical protein LBM75_01875, partial [Myxococcales bacterium]|nr:hypothetical protein [Myxococcales bacterium]